MTWTEARSGATTTARRAAHDDRAKDRRDEADTSTVPRVRPRWLWPAVAVAVLVLVGGSAAVALVGSREEPPPEREAGAAASPSGSDEGPGSGSGSTATATPASAEPLSGDLTATGTVTSTSSLGTRWEFPMTVRLACADACRITVVEAPGEYRLSADAYTQGAYAPGAGGTYRVRINQLLTKGGGYVKPGCEALRVRGESILSRSGETLTLVSRHPKDQFDGSDGPCLLVDREFVFTGTLT